ncbi:MAG: rod shape-determining protein RodA, partial [Candidatus Paceibacterota bacterium]
MEEKLHIDWFTVIMYISIVSFGALNIYSANNTIENHFLFDFKMEYGKQIIWMSASAVIVFLVLLTDFKFFNFSAYGIYVII